MSRKSQSVTLPTSPGALLRDWLQPGSHAPRTLQLYRAGLVHFARWYEGGAVTAGEALLLLLQAGPVHTAAALDRYRADQLQAGLATGTVSWRLAAVRAALKHARRRGWIAWAAPEVALQVSPTQDRRGPTLAQLAQLLASLDDSVLSCRDRAAIRLTFDLALRRAELCALQLSSLEGDPARLAVHRKGGRTVWRTLPGPTQAALASWLRCRGSAPGPLLCACYPDGRVVRPLRALHPGSWAQRLHRLARSAGLPQLRCHGLRHASITAALDAGASPRATAAHGDWSKKSGLAMVATYDDQRADLPGQVAQLVATALDCAPVLRPVFPSSLPK